MSGANPEQLWNLIPNGPTPLTGQEQLLAAQTAAPNAPMYRYPANAFTDAAVVVASSVIATGTTISRTLQNRFADRYSVLDSLTAGQPDGTTDNSADIQKAINAAAGVAQLLIPATANFYVAQGLVIPSNSHIIIESGATIQQPNGATSSMFIIAPFATEWLIEHYGTLDGNAPNQTFVPGHGLSGIVSAGGLSCCSNSRIVGNRLGLITNFLNSPINLTSATNVDVSGVSMVNSANPPAPGGAPQIAGEVQRPGVGSPNITSGTYTGATGLVSLTTSPAHGLVPGQEIGPVSLAGTGGVGNAGTTSAVGGMIFVALPGTSGTTLLYQAVAGGTDATLSAGQFQTWAVPVATIASGTYTSAPARGTADGSGVVSLTTTAPHLLTPGQRILVNATAGTAAVAASGAFILLAGTGGTSLFYNAPSGGSGTTITGGTVSLSTKSYNSGFSNCYCDNINDLTPALYAGCVGCYVRQTEVTRCATGPIIYADAATGRNEGCEISGCYVHGNYGTGLNVATNTSVTTHLNLRIFNNYVTGNSRGGGFGNCDGLDVSNNRFYANSVAAITPGTFASGEIVINGKGNRVKFIGNTIRDAGGGTPLTKITIPITGGTYNSSTGAVSLVRAGGTNLFPGCLLNVVTLTGTGAVASLVGVWEALAGTDGVTTINFQAPVGLGTITITGGSVLPGLHGIILDNPNECQLIDNSIGDYQTPQPTMFSAIGGVWGARGYSAGNFYGPRINADGHFPADTSFYQIFSTQGVSFDQTTGFQCGTTPTFGYGSGTTIDVAPEGLALGTNHSGSLGEVNFFVGAGQNVGGFDFWKIIACHVVSGTYDAGSGAVSLTLNIAPVPAILVGTYFSLEGVIGNDSITGPLPAIGTNLRDLAKLNGNWPATAGTTGTTLNFTAAISLDILSVSNGTVNGSTTDGGQIDTSAGASGKLLGTDFTGNLELCGALVYGAIQQSGTVSSGGTLTILPNLSFVEVQNTASLAAFTLVMPTATALSFPAGGGNVLEVNFQNAIGSLTLTGTVTNAPTAIAAAGTSVSFIANTGSTWLRRIMT